MAQQKAIIRLSCIPGLSEVVVTDLGRLSRIQILAVGSDYVEIAFIEDVSGILGLGSITKATLIKRDQIYNPGYISRHKSVLGEMIAFVLQQGLGDFASFKISCAGPNSPEVRAIATYIAETFKLTEVDDESDLKIRIAKVGTIWEVGAQLTSRPLANRGYRVKNMPGAMDPTIAYALNSLCDLGRRRSYLNPFSGSATLLIEAGLHYQNLEVLLGFDHDKTHIRLAMQNLRQSGLIRRITLKERDIFEQPDAGMFDVIVADLPFGLTISKDANLEELYSAFLDFSAQYLNGGGVLAVYTTEHALFQQLVTVSVFQIEKRLDLTVMTNTNAYLHPAIMVCKFK